MRWSLLYLLYNIVNQLYKDSLPYSKPSWDCWSCIINVSIIFATSTNFKSLNRILIFFFWLLQKEIKTNVSYPASEQNGLKSEARRVDKISEQMRKTIFPLTCCSKEKKHDKREPGVFMEKSRCNKLLCLCSKIHCCYDGKSL